MNFLQRIKYNFQRQGILTQIIIANAAVFLVVNIVGNIAHLTRSSQPGIMTPGSTGNLLLDNLALPIGGERFLFKFWTLFTYMFTHENLGHVFWNMVLFYFMSQIFFTIMGQKKLLYLYVMSGVSGGVLMLLLGMLFPAAFGHSILLGASAAVMGVGAVMAVYSPNYRVFVFGIFEVAYKYLYLAIFAMNTLIDLAMANTGGKISHIGGALFGIIYGYYLKKGTDLFNFSFSFKRKKKSNLTVASRNNNPGAPSRKQQEEHTMDELLDKISKSGYDSLTQKEKDELFRLSQRK